MSHTSDTSVHGGAAALVRSAGALASLPEVAARVIGHVEEPSATPASVAGIISRDPNLTTRLLQVANSPYYGRSGQVTNVARAISVLGLRQVRDLALGISAIRSFNGIPIDVISMGDFWDHSILTATLARRIARSRAPVEAETAFVGGLLHDIGQLLLFVQVPERARNALWLVASAPEYIATDYAERETLGFDHAAVGKQLATSWCLPGVLRDCIGLHHAPAGTASVAVAAVHVANSLAELVEIDSISLADAPPIDAWASHLVGFDAEQLPELLDEAREGLAETRRLFGL